MKKLMSIKELIQQGYPRAWLYEVAHSEDFIEAGGRRIPVKGSKILFDIDLLDHYFAKQTLKNK